MNTLELSYYGDKFAFEYNDADELYLSLNDNMPSTLGRDEVVELIGFLSEFVDQALDAEI